VTTIQVRLPLPRAQHEDWHGARTRYTVTGKRVAIVNDGWGSADDLAAVVEQLLFQDYRVATVEHFKANQSPDRDSERTSDVAQEAFVARVAASSDAAIVMLGNCGSCTAWTCNTSAELSRRGIESAAIVTGLFRPEAEFLLSTTNKMPDHPLIALEDRFEFTDPAALREAAVHILRILFGETLESSRSRPQDVASGSPR
jgi:hypothetical protein